MITTTSTAFVTEPTPVTRTYTLSSDVDSIAEARRHVRATLGAHTDEDTLGRAELVVSELVTNSVRHGPGRPITLHLRAHDDGRIGGELEDHGRGTVAMRDQDPEAAGGLGLVIVDRLTSEWGVYPGSTHVWFRLEP